MSTKTVRLRKNVYERIKSKKRDDETFSEAIDRLTQDVSLLDLADEDGEYDPEVYEEIVGATEVAAAADSEAARELFDGGS